MDELFEEILDETSRDQLWQDGITEYIRAYDSATFYKNILNKGNTGTTLYRCIDTDDPIWNATELFRQDEPSNKKSVKVNLGLTSTTPDQKVLWGVEVDTHRSMRAVVVFSSDTLAWRMPHTDSEYSYQKEFLTFGRFEITPIDKKHYIYGTWYRGEKTDNKPHEDQFKSYVKFYLAKPVDQSKELAVRMQKKDRERVMKTNGYRASRIYNGGKDLYYRDYRKMRMKENHLTEADKSRFIKPLYEEFASDPAFIERIADQSGKDAKVAIPPIETLTKWVNSGDADRYCFQWQQKNKQTLFTLVLLTYWMRREELDARDFASHPEKLFTDEELFKVVDEDENWIFVSPLCYEAAKQMDSYKFGGQGAQWCIGYEKTSNYWNRYISGGDVFIMAMSKKKEDWGTDSVKYMMEFKTTAHNVETWKQVDDPNDTLNYDETEALIGRPPSELFDKVKNFWGSHVKPIGQKFVNAEFIEMNGEKWTADVSQDAYVYLYNLPTEFNYLEFISLCTNADEISRCIVSGKDFPAIQKYSDRMSEDVALISSLSMCARVAADRRKYKNKYFPGLAFMMMESVIINKLTVDNDLFDSHDLLFYKSPVNIRDISYFKEGADYEQFDVSSAIEDFIYLEGCTLGRDPGSSDYFQIEGATYLYADSDYKHEFLTWPHHEGDKTFVLEPQRRLQFDFQHTHYRVWDAENQLFVPEGDPDAYKEVRIYNANLSSLRFPFSLADNTVGIKLINCKIDRIEVLKMEDAGMITSADGNVKQYTVIGSPNEIIRSR